MLESFFLPEAKTGYPPADKVIVSKSGHPRSADPAVRRMVEVDLTLIDFYDKLLEKLEDELGK